MQRISPQTLRRCSAMADHGDPRSGEARTYRERSGATMALRRLSNSWAALGGLTVSTYAVLGVVSVMPRSPLVPAYPPALRRFSPYTTISSLFHGSPASLAVVFVLSLGAAFALYVQALRLAKDAPDKVLIPALWAVVFAAAVVPTPPLASQDIYSYASYGRLAAIHGQNPFLVGPSAAPDDPASNYVGRMWWDMPSVYGPAMQVVSWALASLVGDLSLLVLSLKALAGASLLAALWLLVDCARAYSRSAAFAVVAVGWNPLVVVHIAGGGHNDIFVATLLLAALSAHARHRRILAVLCVTGAALVKFTALVPLGLYLVLLWRKRDVYGGPWRAVAAASTAVMTMAAAYAPFWRGPQTLGALARVAGLTTNISVPAVVAEVFRLGFQGLGLRPLDRSGWLTITRVGAAVCLALVALGLLMKLGRSDEVLPEVWGKALLAFCLTTMYLLPWYLVWPLLLLSLVPTSKAFSVCNGAAFVYAFTQLPGGYVLLSPNVRGIGQGAGKAAFFLAVAVAGIALARLAVFGSAPRYGTPRAVSLIARTGHLSSAAHSAK